MRRPRTGAQSERFATGHARNAALAFAPKALGEGRGRVLRNDQDRYGAVAQTLHWLIAALVAAMFGLGWYMAGLPLEANVQFMTVMATKMPFLGRG